MEEEGSEIYLKPAENYVVTGQPMDFFTITHVAAQKGEVFISYKDITHTDNDSQIKIVINPYKSQTIVFDENDHLIVIAEN